MKPILQIKDLRLEIGERVLCDSLSVEVTAGQRWGVLGRNGAGKTTLLHAILGLRSVQRGAIHILGEPLPGYSRRRLAAAMGILFQQGAEPVPATVMETVLLGRHPHARRMLRDAADDIAAARRAIAALELEALTARRTDTLSGGEMQRVALAMLLAQAPSLYLLDEPGNHLDVAFQMKLMKVLTDAATAADAAVLMATHDINLAARCCTHILLLPGNGKTVTGPTTEVLNENTLSQAYNHPIQSLQQDGIRLFYPQ